MYVIPRYILESLLTSLLAPKILTGYTNGTSAINGVQHVNGIESSSTLRSTKPTKKAHVLLNGTSTPHAMDSTIEPSPEVGQKRKNLP